MNTNLKFYRVGILTNMLIYIELELRKSKKKAVKQVHSEYVL